jgi:hypothetical protein
MSKVRINPTKTLPPTIDKAAFSAPEILSADKIDKAVSALTGQQPSPPPPPTVIPQKFVENATKKKKETAKGTVVVSAMIQKDIMRTLRVYAATHDSTMSDVINRALSTFFSAETARENM